MRDDETYENFFRQMYGNIPRTSGPIRLEGMDRHRTITNYFTRMRLVSHAGEMNFSHKGALEGAPAGFRPWFDVPRPGFASGSSSDTGPRWTARREIVT